MTNIIKLTLPFCNGQVNALLTIPNAIKSSSIAVFSHGYTSHKGSVLNWSLKLADNHMASIVFDLPGHYLGSYNEVDQFIDFTNNAHKLFISATQSLVKHLNIEVKNIVLGGHSLGGLLSIKALDETYFENFEKLIAVTVGVGLPKVKAEHVLQGPFFESMLKQRSNLVSPAINPETMFKWIGDEKAGINTTNKNIFLLTGQDDFISPPANLLNFKEILEQNANQVSIEIKKTLPHHLPDLAATHIKNHLRLQGFL